LSTECQEDETGEACGDLLDTPNGRSCLECLDDDASDGCLACYECSRLFDPVGPDAVSDLDEAGPLSEFRVRIEDRRNGPEAPLSGVYVPMSTVEETSVQLFFLDDLGYDLLVARSGTDNQCTLNPELTPTTGVVTASDHILVVDLVPISPAGESYFPIDGALVECPYGGFWSMDCPFEDAIDDRDCLTPLQHITGEPVPLCGTAELARVIAAEFGEDAAVYGIPPVNGLSCGGNPFDFRAAGIEEGWACVVAMGQDELGNVGISEPLRVCFSAGGVNCNELPLPPTCTDGCEVDAFEDWEWMQLRPLPTGTTQCSDGIDNDGDSLIDYPSDPGCAGFDDDDES